MTFDFDGYVWVITGGARGIGAATAELAAASGATVVIADILDDEAEATVGRIRAAGGEARYERCDLAEPGDIAGVLSVAAAAYGGVDVLHNNAGVTDPIVAGHGADLSLAAVTPERFDRLFAINVRAPLLAAQAAVPYLERSRNPSIINAGSIASFTARPHTLLYAASKAAIAQLTKSLALELAPQRIRVNAYAPGMIETPMAAALLSGAPDPAAARSAVLENYLVDDIGQPEDVAAVVCFLASREARFVNGVVWPVDGGFGAWKGTLGELRR